MFIGTYTRKMQRGGWVRFPKDWLALLGDNRGIFILPDPEGCNSLLIVAADEFRKKLKRAGESSKGTLTRMAFADPAEKVEIAADGRMQIPARLLAHAGIQDGMCFAGHIRTIAVTPSHCA